MGNIKVRFNLGKGKNYMKWKVEYPVIKMGNGKLYKELPHYYDPNEVTLKLFDCTLKNYKGVAKKIFKGENKTVCAWILCKEIIATDKLSNKIIVNEHSQIKYNPRIEPNWVFDDGNADGMKFKRIITKGRGVYVHTK